MLAPGNRICPAGTTFAEQRRSLTAKVSLQGGENASFGIFGNINFGLGICRVKPRADDFTVLMTCVVGYQESAWLEEYSSRDWEGLLLPSITECR